MRVRRTRNTPSPIKQTITPSTSADTNESEMTNKPRPALSPIVLDDSPVKSPKLHPSEKIDYDISQEEDKSNKDSHASQENLSANEYFPETTLEQSNSQTDNTNTSNQTNNQIHNPYQQQRRTGAISTQSQVNPANYSQYQDNASSVNQSTLNTKLAPFVAINDGTHRLTLRWKPSAYHELATDPKYWINKVYGLIHLLFGPYKSKIWIVKWEASQNNDICSLDDIFATKEKLREYMSPKVAHLDSTGQFVFGLRITMRDQSPAAWISDSRTKTVMTNESLNVNISNSKCNSGEIVVAGHLLLKHPEHTHKIFYLMALRRQLPESTPYFDIGPMSKAPNGERIQHLVVRCGENHANVLMDILSDHLDGQKNTTLFVGHKQMASMTT